MKLIPIGAIVTLALLAGCSQPPTCGADKDAFLEGYYELIGQATASKLPASAPQWEQYDEQFRAYVEECYEQYEAELSRKERRRFWASSMKYFAQRYGSGAIKELEQKADNAAEKVRKEVENIWGDAEEALQEATEKAKPEKLLKPREEETQ